MGQDSVSLPQASSSPQSAICQHLKSKSKPKLGSRDDFCISKTIRQKIASVHDSFKFCGRGPLLWRSFTATSSRLPWHLFSPPALLLRFSLGCTNLCLQRLTEPLEFTLEVSFRRCHHLDGFRRLLEPTCSKWT